MSTEYVPPSDEDSEDADIFKAILVKANAKVTQVDPGEYHPMKNGNTVYTNLTPFQPQTSFTGEYFLFILSSILSIYKPNTKKMFFFLTCTLFHCLTKCI